MIFRGTAFIAAIASLAPWGSILQRSIDTWISPAFTRKMCRPPSALTMHGSNTAERIVLAAETARCAVPSAFLSSTIWLRLPKFSDKRERSREKSQAGAAVCLGLLGQYGAGAAACGWFLDAPHDIVENLHPDSLVLFPHGRVL